MLLVRNSRKITGMKSVDRPICFILAGDEQYGVRRLITSILVSMTSEGRDCFAVSLMDGEIVTDLRTAGVDIVSLHLPAPPNFGHAGGGKIRSISKVLRYTISTQRSLYRLLKRSRRQNAFLIVRMPNLVPLVAIVARRLSYDSAWLMPNLVSTNYPLDLNRKLYHGLFLMTGMRPIANSAYTRSTLGASAKLAHVLHLGVREKDFTSSLTNTEARHTLQLPADGAIITVLARLRAEKGHAEIITGMSMLALDVLKDVTLVIVGGPREGEYYDRLCKITRAFSLEDRVRFVGSQSDILPYYAASDLTINWRIDPEPFGLSVVESLMMSRPVIAHGTGGPAETIKDGVTGWLSADPSPHGFRDILIRALSERFRWEEMGCASRADALGRFETSVVATNLIKVVEDIKNRRLMPS